jgi:hypothetical protein
MQTDESGAPGRPHAAPSPANARGPRAARTPLVVIVLILPLLIAALFVALSVLGAVVRLLLH